MKEPVSSVPDVEASESPLTSKLYTSMDKLEVLVGRSSTVNLHELVYQCRIIALRNGDPNSVHLITSG